MVVGNGLVAKAFSAYEENDDVVIFASGVSNSKESDDTAFEKEIGLVKEVVHNYPEKIFVYFSTTSIDDKSLQDKKYVQHKLYIESLIAETCSRYYIFRISNIVGRTGNPNTIINFFTRHIQDGEPFAIWENAYRNIIDIDDVFRIGSAIIDNGLHANSIINIAYPHNIAVTEIVATIESFLGKKGIYTRASFGENYLSSTSLIAHFFNPDPLAPAHYLRRMLDKYLIKPQN